MELDYLNVILDAKKEDYNKQSNLKKFYKETLTEDEFKTFEKVLKEKKSEITELENIVVTAFKMYPVDSENRESVQNQWDSSRAT